MSITYLREREEWTQAKNAKIYMYAGSTKRKAAGSFDDKFEPNKMCSRRQAAAVNSPYHIQYADWQPNKPQ